MMRCPIVGQQNHQHNVAVIVQGDLMANVFANLLENVVANCFANNSLSDIHECDLREYRDNPRHHFASSAWRARRSR